MDAGARLVQKGVLSPEQLDAARAAADRVRDSRSLTDELVRQGLVSERDALDALGDEFGVPVCHDVRDELLDANLVERLPVDWARSRAVLPVHWEGGRGVLTANPGDVEAQEDLALMLGQELVPVLARREDIRDAIERCYYQRRDSTQEFIDRIETPAIEAGAEPRRTEASDLLRVSEQAPVARLVNLILLEALKAGASDVHIEPFEQQTTVRYRIDGLLYDQPSPPKHLETALVSRLKVMGKLDIAERRLPQDGMARVTVGDQEVDIRLSTLPVAEGERVVLRLLNQSTSLIPLDRLGMETEVLEPFREVMQGTEGVVILTGPTGSGKTTTLYSALSELDTRALNVLTIEDPIEYQLSNIGQMQVKPKIGLTFAAGLRHILRQDPDVILVGEVRDRETAEIVTRASLTGHLVFTTLHTNDAASAVVRLVDMGVAPYLLASSLRAVLAQRLARALCPSCKREAVAGEEQLRSMGAQAERLRGQAICFPEGCPRCLGGYRGRTGLFEWLPVDEALQEAIRSGGDSRALQREARARGAGSLLESGIAKILSGTTSVEEVVRTVGSPR